MSQAARTHDTDFSNDTDADLLTLISWKEDDESARMAWGEFYERRAQCEQLRPVLESLKEREFDVLMARFSNFHRAGGKQQFDPEVLADLAERWQVTKDYVRQILSRAMRKIKEQLS